MYKFDLAPDPKKIAAIEARRNEEKEQQCRFFNVQNRIMGVDVEALNYQVEERELRKAIERSDDMAYDKLRLGQNKDTKHAHSDLVAQMLKKEEAEWACRLSKRLQDFREQRQQLKNGHEFGFWNPNQLYEFPAPYYYSVPYFGPSSMQYFPGEDLERESCLRMQQEWFKDNLKKQLQEQQQAAREEEVHVALLSEQLCLAADTRAAELARLEESCKAAMRIAMANANKAQAKLSEFDHLHQPTYCPVLPAVQHQQPLNTGW